MQEKVLSPYEKVLLSFSLSEANLYGLGVQRQEEEGSPRSESLLRDVPVTGGRHRPHQETVLSPIESRWEL